MLHAVLKGFFTAVFGVIGTLFLLQSLGLRDVPTALRYTPGEPPIDKFVGAAELLGLGAGNVNALFGLLALCKLTAAVGFWVSPAVDRIVTMLAAVMLACVSVGHYYIDGDFVPSLFTAALVVVKLYTTPISTVVKKTKTNMQ